MYFEQVLAAARTGVVGIWRQAWKPGKLVACRMRGLV
jgi:hypothetical protein